MLSRLSASWLFGFCLLFSLVGLAVLIALGEVDELHSFGLKEIVLALALFTQQWCNYKFTRKRSSEKQDPNAN